MAEYEKLPYIGISGANGDIQQRTLELLWDTYHLHDQRRLLLGVKAVHKTQWLDTPNKYGSSWYPVGEEAFSKALLRSGESYGVAQMYLDPESIAGDRDYPRAFVDRIVDRGRRWLNAIQFDMLPYNQTDPAQWHGLFEHIHGYGIDVILQCHKRAMEAGPAGAIEHIKSLGPIDYVLFDASHGKGVEMDPEALLPFLDVAHSDRTLAGDHTSFGVAGGLSAERVRQHLPRLAGAFPDISWDAEGKLHPTPQLTRDPDSGEDVWSVANEGAVNTGFAWQYMQASADVIRGR
jgi:hypothetical protein